VAIAQPIKVEMNLKYTPKELRLRIHDDGCGFESHGLDKSKAGHYGLVEIRERVKSLAGNLALNSQPGKGTEILVMVPIG
jgi:signal transduction histidine kinase